MTICIAAICDLGKEGVQSPGIVFCADRLISGGIKFEHGIPKIKWIPGRAVVMEAGDGSILDLVLDKEFIKLSTATKEVKQIALLLQEKINFFKQNLIQQRVLSKWGLTYESYLNKISNLNELILNSIEEEIKRTIYDIELEFIVAGLDEDGTPQLFKISEQEGLQCYNSIGFIAIGSGTSLSFIEITKFTHKNYVELSEAILKVYCAKKNSERTDGVGSLTDIGFLTLKKLNDSEITFYTDLLELPPEFKDFLDLEIQEIVNSENKIKTTIIEKIREKLAQE